MSSRLMLYSTLLLGLLSAPITHAAGLNPPQVSGIPKDSKHRQWLAASMRSWSARGVVAPVLSSGNTWR